MRLALGTVQFGLAYGIAGRDQPVSPAQTRAILEEASADGVDLLDTAASYGDIEPRLAALVAGLPLGVVTKVGSLAEHADPARAARAALASASRSHDRLGPAMRALLLHDAADLDGTRGRAVWEALAPWARARGIALGASCYGPRQLHDLRRTLPLALAQLPGSALDQRIARDGIPNGVEVHLRSTFLQGLLLMPAGRAAARLPRAAEALARWHAWCARESLTPLEAALAVARAMPGVSRIVVGVDGLSHWREIARAWQAVAPMHAPALACDDPEVIDPRRWRLAA